MPAVQGARAPIEIAPAGERIAPARELLREYEAELRIDLCFQDFEGELASLPGAYVPPDGCLLLAAAAGELAGCVALRRHEGSTAELKRLYVRPAARGSGVARALTHAALAHARARGYREVVLDTLPGMVAAQALHRSLGFLETGPYRANPVAGASFMALAL